VTVRLFNGLRLRVYCDCDTSPAAVYYSIPNGNHISFLRKHLEGGTFIDVGANVGLVSLLVADKVQHAVLFEPNPIAVIRARENLGINRLNFEVFSQMLEFPPVEAWGRSANLRGAQAPRSERGARIQDAGR